MAKPPPVILAVFSGDPSCFYAEETEKMGLFQQAHHVLLVWHSPTGVNIDVTLASLPLEQEAIAHRQFFDFAGIQVAFPQLEDLVIYK